MRLWFQQGSVIECAQTVEVRPGERFVLWVAGVRRSRSAESDNVIFVE